MKPIGHMESDFPEKFGIPRQSGLVKELISRIVMEPEYRVAAAFKGIEQYTHLWILWEFSENKREEWLPTVRPPKLGGNTRMGVFATRSPFRPNPIGLSCVQFEKLELDEKLGPVLYVSGADLMDGTPVYDIKPYLPYVDSHPDAKGGFSDKYKTDELEVIIQEDQLEKVPSDKRQALIGILKQDPRPSYQNDPERIYGCTFAGKEIKFQVRERQLKVISIL